MNGVNGFVLYCPPPFWDHEIIPPLPHPDKENISKPYKFKDL